jgi:hypothetical protein
VGRLRTSGTGNDMKIRLSLLLMATGLVASLFASEASAARRRVKPLPCEPLGVYDVLGAPISIGTVFQASRIDIAGTQTGAPVEIPGFCPPVPAIFRARRGFTVVVARWLDLCPGYRRFVLKGKIYAPGCDTLDGFVRGRGLKKVSFLAVDTTAPTTTTLAPPSTTSTSLAPPLGSTTTSVATATTTTTTLRTGCCGAEQIVSRGGTGSLTMGGSFPGFAFPAGATLTVNVGPPDETCRHEATVPRGGFGVPAFCITALSYTSDILFPGCDVGSADGRGTVWDGVAPTSGLFCPDAEVRKVADTRDGVCDEDGPPPGVPCPGLGPANALGDVDQTVGDGVCELARGMHTQLDIPATIITWQDGDGTAPFCPDEDGVYDPGEDTLISMARLVLSPTTSTATASFLDKNADGCFRQGLGPNGPIGVTGSPAEGPCCAVGQGSTLAFAGAVFSGGGPLYDYLYKGFVPMTVTACNPGVPLEECELTDACLR